MPTDRDWAQAYRLAADTCDRKAGEALDRGDQIEADRLWDKAIDLRVLANDLWFSEGAFRPKL
jgi:hypothetical protein